MTLSVGITINNISYTPEAYAYEHYLNKHGVDAHLAYAHELDSSFDIHIYFMGLLPFWKKRGKWHEIHEYQSLSTPSFAKLKDFTKKVVNRKPEGRIFLNSTVEQKMGFSDAAPRIIRDMGIDESLFLPPPKNPHYDLIYCGSIRKGLDVELKRLSILGFKILIVGKVDSDFMPQLKKQKNIEFAGQVQRKELASIYRQARAGLNFNPNIYPFNIQTSTKVLEYCAAGLGVISNKYEWSINFNRSRGSHFMWLEDLNCKESFEKKTFHTIDVTDLKWDKILDSCSFKDFILNTPSSNFK